MNTGRRREWTVAVVAVVIVLAMQVAFADSFAHGAKVRSLMQQPLPDFPGKESLVLRVDFPPGHVDPPHRHDAHAFVYVLDGSIEMQVAGGKPVVLKPGDIFYEGPQDVHPVGRNMSRTKPAKLLVFFVKDQGKAPVLPATKD